MDISEIERINLDGWFVGANEMSRSFLRFCVKINFLIVEEGIMYQMKINDSSAVQLTLNFKTLASAIGFAEKSVIKSDTLSEVYMRYEDIYLNTSLQKKIPPVY